MEATPIDQKLYCQRGSSSKPRGRGRGRGGYRHQKFGSELSTSNQSPDQDSSSIGKYDNYSNEESHNSNFYHQKKFNGGGKTHRKNFKPHDNGKVQKGKMEDMCHSLSNSSYECMICYDTVKIKDRIWDCETCYAVFHLKCVQTWGEKSFTEKSGDAQGWRCPGCQGLTKDIPTSYKCYCKKVDQPTFTRFITPHSCGQTCGKERDCPHNCNLLCHPGPCPECQSFSAPTFCYCSKKKFIIRCHEMKDLNRNKSCGELCEKTLNCGIHQCQEICHVGECPPCEVLINQNCFGHENTRTVTCGDAKGNLHYSCGDVCNYQFNCGFHSCQEVCHPTEFHPTVCPLDPSLNLRCCCGKEDVNTLTPKRTLCTEPLVCCKNRCSKELLCGHECTAKCHDNECPTCRKKIDLQCRCGSKSFQVSCAELKRIGDTSEYELPQCNNVCNKKFHCKKHKCEAKCCNIDYHVCDEICGKSLKCGLHNCMLGCGHPGKCHDCLDGVSFEELSCNCGKTKMYPPIPCNTPTPICRHPCVRPNLCGHTSWSIHPCHRDDEPCPPCMIFTERKCACEKKEMKNIPCSSLRSPSCGLMCEKLIEGCGHNCKRFCHVGECVDAVHSCQERCRRTRAICGHRCKYFCHGTSFCTEEKPCLAVVTSTCACGRRKVEQKCGADKENLGISKVELPCDEGCAVMERNKRLAEAFDKVEDDEIVSSELDYSESLAKFAHTKPEECKNVEEKLATFVADQTKNYFYFPKSKMKKSLFISELATQHYNLNAEILDANIGMANVVVRKGVGKKGQIPALLLSEVAVNYSPQLYENINLHKQNNQLSHTEIIENSKENNFNGIFLRNISFGIEVNDLKILLEPFFHTNFIPSLKKIKNVCKEDCFIILFNTNKQDPNQNFEKDLKNFYKIVEKKFCIDNNFASSCNLCFVDCEGRVNLKDDFGEELYKKEEILSTNNLQKKNSFNNENLKNSTLENSFNKFNILDDE